jgi:hypothetical protein
MRFSFSEDMPTSSALLAQGKSSATLAVLDKQKTRSTKGRERLLVKYCRMIEDLFSFIFLLIVVGYISSASPIIFSPQ